MRINSWNVIDIVTDIRLVKWLKLTTLSPLAVKLEFFFIFQLDNSSIKLIWYQNQLLSGTGFSSNR